MTALHISLLSNGKQVLMYMNYKMIKARLTGDLQLSPLFCTIISQNSLDRATSFREGSLPFTYLGFPITTNKLSEVESRALIEKITGKVRMWATGSLSFTGRAQLLNSVIFGMYNYWATIFILPQEKLVKIKELFKQPLSDLLGIAGRECKGIYGFLEIKCTNHGVPLPGPGQSHQDTLSPPGFSSINDYPLKVGWPNFSHNLEGCHAPCVTELRRPFSICFLIVAGSITTGITSQHRSLFQTPPILPSSSKHSEH
ncbi:LOW QUALITY PROTEIN: hypothetical protein Cgig2_018752 [Carnegiea gigantea]|uniref:Uncharacterized protein n=1 Tax=Carnegiea gigantea TaxID=171969 RepID=A0A9Q1JIJ5_9CARY|nr:LOW QUALITY PROTEIN: hypothetical protein Cgig2_018752 [Carnegiea gigantea]